MLKLNIFLAELLVFNSITLLQLYFYFDISETIEFCRLFRVFSPINRLFGLTDSGVFCVDRNFRKDCNFEKPKREAHHKGIGIACARRAERQ